MKTYLAIVALLAFCLIALAGIRAGVSHADSVPPVHIVKVRVVR